MDIGVVAAFTGVGVAAIGGIITVAVKIARAFHSEWNFWTELFRALGSFAGPMGVGLFAGLTNAQNAGTRDALAVASLVGMAMWILAALAVLVGKYAERTGKERDGER